MLHSWDVEPGTATPKTATMLDFNLWTFNSRVFPGIDHVPVRLGERVRFRIANLSMTSHPIHTDAYRSPHRLATSLRATEPRSPGKATGRTRGSAHLYRSPNGSSIVAPAAQSRGSHPRAT